MAADSGQGLVIAVDAMGGDHGPEVTVPASVEAVRRFSDLSLILTGRCETLEPLLQRWGGDQNGRLRIHHASETVAMDEPPAQALRNKKDSSLRVAINLVRDGSARAMVSAGNTGALMATARFVLKTLPGIDRPAIVSTLPTLRGHVHMLDLGATVDTPAEQLVQFAYMGSILVSATEGRDRPRIGLLSNGKEDIKGNEAVRRAQELLRASELNYCGFVEGDEIFLGDFDVIVCDGFVGNVALKTSEGLAKMMGAMTREEFTRTPLRKISGLMAAPALGALKRRLDPRRYNGATFAGLNGTVIKSHGGADRLAFRCALEEARVEARHDVPQRIGEGLARLGVTDTGLQGAM